MLAFMLAVASSWSIYELNAVGSSVQKILDENYQSIYAAKEMKEALERQDSGILLLLLGKWQQGRAILASADSIFEAKVQFAEANITIPGEQQHLHTIRHRYSAFKKLWERPIVDTEREGNLDWYSRDVHRAFLSLKESINALIALNDKMMYQTASNLENRTHRDIMPDIVAVIAALVFSFIFAYLIHYYIVSPIIEITHRINKFKDKRTPYDVEIETKDEILHLSEAIQHLCATLEIKDAEK